MAEAPRGHLWRNAGAYEAYMGRWSRQIAEVVLAWLRPPPDGSWLDVGCGTGALSESILREAAPAEVVGVDPSDGFVAHAREHVRDGRVRFEVGDAQALPFEDGEFDAVVSGLVLNFIPDSERGVAEMTRVARPDGVVAAYVWDYAGEMQLMRHFWDAAAALDPTAVELD